MSHAYSLPLIAHFLVTAGLAMAADPGDDLDRHVLAILKSKCALCHDDKRAAAGGGVDNLLDLGELASGYVDAAAPEKSGLFDLTQGDNARMPKKQMKEVVWNGPLSAAEKGSLEKWIRRGGPSDQYRQATAVRERAVIAERQIVERIAADLGRLSGTELKNARYLTLTNLHNHRGIRDDELELYRHGMVKMLNSLSRVSDVLGLDISSAVNKVIAVDTERTIFRFDLKHIGWTNHDWDRVAQHFPYALIQRGGTGTAVYKLTSSELPYLRADWFVFATSQPPLYHDLVGIPNALAKLEEDLKIDRLQAIRDRHVARAGMEHSKVSVNNRLLERIPMAQRAGSYHISYDFATNNGLQNFFENPLGPVGAFRTDFAFQHDGGEVIFHLPNGFQAYALVTAKGDRLDTAPQAIVQDNTMPGSVIINGVSCISCHYQGMKPEAGDARLATLDEVREAGLANRRRFSEAERELIGELFPPHGQFTALIEQDRKRFLDALTMAGIAPRGSDEPVRALFDRFVKDLDLSAVAAEFGLTPDDCRTQMQLESETRQLLLRIERGTLKRQLYLTAFQQIARLTGAGDTRNFVKLPFPYFGEKVESASAAVATPAGHAPSATASPNWAHTGVDLLDAEHRTGQLKVTMRTEGERRNYVEDEPLRCQVRATEDCFLTVVSVDPTGDITLLLPNKWHPEFKLKAGQTVAIPTREMAFEFYATPPHGQTVLKAIATKRPLDLKGVNRQALQQKGLLSLGNAKAIGVRAQQPGAPAVATPHVELTDRKLEEMFLPNEWATTSWTLTTHK